MEIKFKDLSIEMQEKIAKILNRPIEELKNNQNYEISVKIQGSEENENK